MSKTLDERYNHAPGSFDAAIDAFEIPGEPVVSQIIRAVGRENIVLPSHMIGSGSVPIGSRFAFARRLAWRGVYDRTDLSIENIAELFGYAVGTVRPWARSWEPFEKQDPVWWRYWGLSQSDLVGCARPEVD